MDNKIKIIGEKKTKMVIVGHGIPLRLSFTDSTGWSNYWSSPHELLKQIQLNVPKIPRRHSSMDAPNILFARSNHILVFRNLTPSNLKYLLIIFHGVSNNLFLMQI